MASQFDAELGLLRVGKRRHAICRGGACLALFPASVPVARGRRMRRPYSAPANQGRYTWCSINRQHGLLQRFELYLAKLHRAFAELESDGAFSMQSAARLCRLLA